MTRVLGTFAQIVLAVTLVACLAVLGLAVYNRDALTRAASSAPAKRRVDVFRGMMDLAENQNVMYPGTTLALPPSLNQPGGLEYSYNFWLFMPKEVTPDSKLDTTRSGITTQDAPLLLRGVPKAIQYKGVCPGNNLVSDFLTKAPFVKLTGPNRDVLAVELNTSRTPHGGKSKPRCDGTANDWSAMNGHRLAVSGMASDVFKGRWSMITVTVAGGNNATSTEPLPARDYARVRVYVNGRFMAEQQVEDVRDDDFAATLRGNGGPLVVAPTDAYNNFTNATPKHAIPPASTVTDVKMRMHMANLSYFNYALTEDEARAVFADGFDKKIAESNTQISRAKLTTLLDIANSRSVLSAQSKDVVIVG